MSGRFWLVWCESGHSPTFKHESYDSAAREAERLARQVPGKRFHVLERVASCVKVDVQWDGEQPIPF